MSRGVGLIESEFPVSPGVELANPYDNDPARLRATALPVRAAARALAVGAIGLGAAVTFAGTGFADEADPADGTSESAQESAQQPDDGQPDDGQSDDGQSDDGQSGDEQSGDEEAGDESGAAGPGDPATQVGGEDTDPAQAVDEESSDGQASTSPAPRWDDDEEAPEPRGAGGEQVEQLILDTGSGSPVPGLPDGDPVDFYEQVGDGTLVIDGVEYYLLPPQPAVEAPDGGDPGVVDGAAPGDDGTDESPLPDDARLRFWMLPPNASSAAPDDDTEGVPSGELPPVEIAHRGSGRTPEAVLTMAAEAPSGGDAPEEPAGAVTGSPGALTLRGPGVTDSRLDVDLGEGRIGGTANGYLAQAEYEVEGSVPLGADSRIEGSSVSTLDVLPTEAGVYLAGAPEGSDPAENGPSVDVDPRGIADLLSDNRFTVSTGTPRPEEMPTGNETVEWSTVGFTGEGNLDAGVTGRGVSGTVTGLGRVFLDAGADSPDTGWYLTGGLGAEGTVALGPTGTDPQLTTTADFAAGGRLGDRRDDEGDFEDPDGDGLRPGAVAFGEVFGSYTNVGSGTATVPTRSPGVTATIPADTSRYRAGLEAGFEVREEQPTFAAGLEGTATAGVEGASARTEYGRTSSGPDVFVDAELIGDAEVRTAPPGQDRVYARVDGRGSIGLADGVTTTAYAITPGVGGEWTIGDTTVDGSVGYRFGGTDGESYDGVVAGLGAGFNAFDGRGHVGVEYSGAHADSGDDGVALAFDFVPGAARHTTEPEPGPVETSATPPEVSSVDLPVAEPAAVVPPTGSGDGVPVPQAPAASAPSEPGPVVDEASYLEGTVAATSPFVVAGSAEPEAPSAPDLTSDDPVAVLPPVEEPASEPVEVGPPDVEPVVTASAPDIGVPDLGSADGEPDLIASATDIEVPDVELPDGGLDAGSFSDIDVEPSPAFSSMDVSGFDVSSAPDVGSLDFGGFFG